MGIASAHQFQIQLVEAKRANNLSHSSHNLGKGWQANTTTDTSSIGPIITQRFALRFLILPTGYSHEDKRKSNRLVGHPPALALRKFGSASNVIKTDGFGLKGDLWSRRTSKRLIKPLMPGISNMLLLLEAAVHVIFHAPSPALGATVFGTTT